MPVTIELPRPLEEELTQEAQREGVSATEHATLLLYLAHALVSEGSPTPFKEAVRVFLARHSLDADHVSSAFEELVRSCLTQDDGEPSFSRLKQWRDALVHAADPGAEVIPTSAVPLSQRQEKQVGETPPLNQKRDPELVARVKSIRGRFGRPGAGWASEELHRERQ